MYKSELCIRTYVYLHIFINVWIYIHMFTYTCMTHICIYVQRTFLTVPLLYFVPSHLSIIFANTSCIVSVFKTCTTRVFDAHTPASFTNAINNITTQEQVVACDSMWCMAAEIGPKSLWTLRNRRQTSKLSMLNAKSFNWRLPVRVVWSWDTHRSLCVPM